MKNSIKALAMLAIVIMMAQSANAQGNTATASGVSGTATVVIPITITKHNDMDFGVILQATTGGTVSFSYASGTTAGTNPGTGTLTYSNAANRANNHNGTPAWFTVTGDQNCSFTVSRTGDATNGHDFLLHNGTHSMEFDFNASPAAQSLSTTGTIEYTVGGDLHIGANQTAGTYVGTWDETVTYD